MSGPKKGGRKHSNTCTREDACLTCTHAPTDQTRHAQTLASRTGQTMILHEYVHASAQCEGIQRLPHRCRRADARATVPNPTYVHKRMTEHKRETQTGPRFKSSCGVRNSQPFPTVTNCQTHTISNDHRPAWQGSTCQKVHRRRLRARSNRNITHRTIHQPI